MGSAGGVLRIAVGLPGGVELLGEGALVALIADGTGLVAAGNAVVILLEQRHEHLDKARAGGIERLAVLDELRIPEGHHGLVPLAVVPHLLEEAVALLESLIILYKMLEILAMTPSTNLRRRSLPPVMSCWSLGDTMTRGSLPICAESVL